MGVYAAVRAEKSRGFSGSGCGSLEVSWSVGEEVELLLLLVLLLLGVWGLLLAAAILRFFNNEVE